MSKHSSDQQLLFAHMFLLLVGLVSLVSWRNFFDPIPLWQFLIGTSFVTWGFAVSQVQLISLYSKFRSSFSPDTMMGFLGAGGALARMLGPIWSSQLYQKTSQSFVFATLTAGIGIGLVLLLILYCSGIIQRSIEKRFF